jgi:sporulation protein YlmC with PRC-barrel domain
LKRDGPLKLLSEVRDLQIVDCDGRNCGICDDIEFDGGPGKPLIVTALLVGPGAYKRRLPRWAFRLATFFLGRRVIRVPWESVDTITSRIHLAESAQTMSLGQVDTKLQRAFKKIPYP